MLRMGHFTAPTFCRIGYWTFLLPLYRLRVWPSPTISQLRHLIRTLNYVVSTHAAEELEDDNLSILDLENIILTGKITERQRDIQTRESKVVVSGITLDDKPAQAVVKIGFTGKLIVITAYVL